MTIMLPKYQRPFELRIMINECLCECVCVCSCVCAWGQSLTVDFTVDIIMWLLLSGSTLTAKGQCDHSKQVENVTGFRSKSMPSQINQANLIKPHVHISNLSQNQCIPTFGSQAFCRMLKKSVEWNGEALGNLYASRMLPLRGTCCQTFASTSSHIPSHTDTSSHLWRVPNTLANIKFKHAQAKNTTQKTIQIHKQAHRKVQVYVKKRLESTRNLNTLKQRQ